MQSKVKLKSLIKTTKLTETELIFFKFSNTFPCIQINHKNTNNVVFSCFSVLSDPNDSLQVANTCLSKPYVYNFAKELYNNDLNTAEGKSMIT